MSSIHIITCKKECIECSHKSLYDINHNYPFRCYRPNQPGTPAIKTSVYCGKDFVPPNNELQSCKYHKPF